MLLFELEHAVAKVDEEFFVDHFGGIEQDGHLVYVAAEVLAAQVPDLERTLDLEAVDPDVRREGNFLNGDGAF
ncbi:MAG TPA: hypothetical protein VNJ01_06325 [Bacteriovoracaceae bacterium]|nr:hypothetical protein [Bacteriovoracaceae bacterium]